MMGQPYWRRSCGACCSSFYLRLFISLLATFLTIQSAIHTRNESTRLLLDQVLDDIHHLHSLQSAQLKHHEDVVADHLSVKGMVAEQEKKLEELAQMHVGHRGQLGKQGGVLQDIKEALEKRHRLRAPLRRNYISPHDPTEFRSGVFVPFGTYGFIRFSAYRTSSTRIVALGLATLSLASDRRLGGCFWHAKEGGGVIDGTLTMVSAREHHNLQYEIVRLDCDLGTASPQGGGWLVGNIDNEGVVLYVEEGSYIVDPPQPWKSKLTYCSSPLYGIMDVRRVWEWFEYHRVVVGMDGAVLYNVGAVTNELRAALKDYYEAGWVEEVDFQEAQSYDTWLYCQLLTVTDCVYRSRLTSKWVFMADTDEYMVPKAPLTIGSILREHKDAAYITHGQTQAGSEKCLDVNRPNVFTVERITFRWPNKVYCSLDNHEDFDEAMRPLCLDHFGHRKYLLNPRKVRGAAIHLVFDSEPGVDMRNRDELTHWHFSGLTLPFGSTLTKGLCDEIVSHDFDDGWWVKDSTIAEMVPRIKSCTFSNRSCVEQID